MCRRGTGIRPPGGQQLLTYSRGREWTAPTGQGASPSAHRLCQADREPGAIPHDRFARRSRSPERPSLLRRCAAASPARPRSGRPGISDISCTGLGTAGLRANSRHCPTAVKSTRIEPTGRSQTKVRHGSHPAVSLQKRPAPCAGATGRHSHLRSGARQGIARVTVPPSAWA